MSPSFFAMANCKVNHLRESKTASSRPQCSHLPLQRLLKQKLSKATFSSKCAVVENCKNDILLKNISYILNKPI